MPQVKVRFDRQVKIPASLFAKYRLQEGDTLEVRDTENGIVLIPKNGTPPKADDRFFELIERTWARNGNIDSKALDRTIDRAVRAVRAEGKASLNK